MLTIIIPSGELWDEKREEFILVKETILHLEHSLVSISKWESIWCKSFFSMEEKTNEEVESYVKCMTITKNVRPEVYLCLTQENFMRINQYIEAPMTATTFFEDQNRRSGRRRITSELIYYWMTTLGIPWEAQKWHINRLLTLIRVFEEENSPPKKMSQREVINRYADLNAARRKQLNSKG